MLKKRINYEKASTLIVTIIQLSFFLVISVSLFYSIQKKSEKVTVETETRRIDSYLESGNSIGSYELYKSYLYNKIGFAYLEDHPAFLNGYKPYVQPTNDNTYYYVDDFGEIKKNEEKIGIYLENFNDYFASRWIWDGDKEDIEHYMIEEETIENGRVKSRRWREPNERKVERLWGVEDSNKSKGAVSLGGYRIKYLKINNENINLDDNIKKDVEKVLKHKNKYEFESTYEKIVIFYNVGVEDIPVKYRITYIENAIVNTNRGKKIEDIVIEEEKAGEILVEKIN